MEKCALSDNSNIFISCEKRGEAARNEVLAIPNACTDVTHLQREENA